MTLFPVQDAFTRGEISPRLHARASLELYRGALAKCRNFVTLPHGGLRKRAGTYFVAPVKPTGKTVRLIDFRFSEEQAYCLEFGDLYCRVYAYGSFITEISTPWTAEQLKDIQYTQSGDVMWLVHPLHEPRKIVRYGATTWGVEIVSFTDGPFGPVNTNQIITMHATATTGNVNLRTSAPVFSPSDVGRIVKLEMVSYTLTKPWEPTAIYAVIGDSPYGKRCRYDGNVYFNTLPAVPSSRNYRYGSTPPTHTRGEEIDGQIAPDQDYDGDIVGAGWRYMHSGFGVARITGYVSPTEVFAVALTLIPEEVVGAANGTPLWSFGAFRQNAHPSAVTLFEERLFFANKLSVYGSKTGEFTSFKTGEKDDDGLEFVLASNQANDIVWLADADGYLAIGTIGGVRSLAGSGVDEALTPSSFKNRSSSTQRCGRHRPIQTGQAFLYVGNGNRTLSEMVLNANGRFESVDAMQVSEHIAKQTGGIAASAYQEAPDPQAWLVMNSGELVGFTYQRDQEVRGFHRHDLGGRAISVCVTPGRDGPDDVWVVVEREIAGETRTTLEILQSPNEYGAPASDFHVHCGLSRSGPSVTTLTGLDHLNGAEIEILADDEVYSGRLVTDGSVTLPRPAGTISAGLPLAAEAATLELDVGAKDGSIIGRRKRVVRVYLSLFETDLSGLEISSVQRGRWETVRLPSVVKNAEKSGRFTGNVEVPVDDSWEGGAQIRIRHSGPKSCTIRAVIPAFDSEP